MTGSGRRGRRLTIWTCLIVPPPFVKRDSGPVTDDTNAYIAITRLQASYADAVTRRAWSVLGELFLPDCPVSVDTITRPVINLTGPNELGTFINGALERFDFFEFVILNTVVDVSGPDAATGRLYIVEIRHERASDEWSQAFGRYDDSYTQHDGRWRFAERRYRSLARRSAGVSEILAAADPATRRDPT